MMDIREKLVELLMQVEDNMCDDCGREPVGCAVVAIADHLIAHGVTVSEEVEELKADNQRLREMWAKAVSELSKASAVQEWIPVTERLPEKGEEVLVFDTRENWIGFAWLHPDETWTALGFDFPFDLGEVTHWMPLPSAPKGVSEDGVC